MNADRRSFRAKQHSNHAVWNIRRTRRFQEAAGDAGADRNRHHSEGCRDRDDAAISARKLRRTQPVHCLPRSDPRLRKAHFTVDGTRQSYRNRSDDAAASAAHVSLATRASGAGGQPVRSAPAMHGRCAPDAPGAAGLRSIACRRHASDMGSVLLPAPLDRMRHGHHRQSDADTEGAGQKPLVGHAGEIGMVAVEQHDRGRQCHDH